MIISDYLSINAKKYVNSEAIVEVDSTLGNVRYSLSWLELNTLSNRIGSMLINNNIKKGEKIGIVLKNSIVWLPIYFGIMKLGAIPVLVNHHNTIQEIEYCLTFAECSAVFISSQDKCYNYLSETGWRLFQSDNIHVLNDLLVDCSGSDIHITSLMSEPLATIYYSSGTTGTPKAVAVTHSALLNAAQMELAHHFQSQEDRFLCLTPLFHAGSKIHWFGSLLVGGAIVLYNSSSPMGIINIIEKEKISITFLLMPQIQDILDACEAQDIIPSKYDLSRWRLMHSGSQHIPTSLIKHWHEKFPWQSYDTNYGLTESTGPGCIHLGVNNIHKAGAIGKPDPGWQFNIVRDNGLSVNKGEIGELIIKGPGVMAEYYKDIESTQKTIVDGWLYTGDMAYVDEDNYIYIADRKKNIIISGGENIYPIQIESHLQKLPNIKDVAIIGIPNRRMGELVAAVIELDSDSVCTKKDIISYCSSLPSYQMPRRIVFGHVIRNSTGKIDKNKMRKLYFYNSK